MAISVRALRAQCGALADDLTRNGQASLEEVRAVEPGGADNPKRDGSAWVRCYGQLQLMRGRAQGSTNNAGRAGAADVRAADALALAALAEQPSPVSSAPGLRVYPKSFATLMHCHAREMLVGHLARVVGQANRHGAPDDVVSILEEAAAELSYQSRLLAWIATSEGPALPFDEAAPRPEIPPVIADLSALVVLDINRGFATVNWSSLRAMEALITPDPDDGTPSKRLAWSPFFGTLSLELGVSPLELLRNRSLASVLASTKLAASSRREAMADAKAKADRERDQRRDAPAS